MKEARKRRHRAMMKYNFLEIEGRIYAAESLEYTKITENVQETSKT